MSLGKTLAELRQMPEADLRLYARYAAETGLPARRMEVYAAQLAYCTLAALGGYKGGLGEFVLPDVPTENPAPAAADDADDRAADWRDNPMFAGFNPQ